jgi:hypothetical protein
MIRIVIVTTAIDIIVTTEISAIIRRIERIFGSVRIRRIILRTSPLIITLMPKINNRRITNPIALPYELRVTTIRPILLLRLPPIRYVVLI